MIRLINYYIVSCSGKNINIFINKILKLNIDILKIEYFKDEVLIYIKYEDIKKIKEVKGIYNIKIVGTHGKRRIKALIMKYRMFLCFFILSIFIIIFLSRLILFINIDVINKDVYDAVYKDLNSNNVSLFSISKDFNYYERLADIIKSNNPSLIEWIEIKHNGVFLNVSVIERKNNISVPNKNVITDIVASKNAIIRDIYSTSGQLVKFKDDYVSKGDVIVSGIIRRNDNVVGSRKSSGLVFGEVWYRIVLGKPYKYISSKSSDICYVNYDFNVLGYEFNALRFKSKKCKKNGVIYSGGLLKLKRRVENILIKNNVSYDKETLKKELEDEAFNKISKDLGDREKILEQKTLKTYDKDGKMYVEVFMKVYEDISLEVETSLPSEL